MQTHFGPTDFYFQLIAFFSNALRLARAYSLSRTGVCASKISIWRRRTEPSCSGVLVTHLLIQFQDEREFEVAADVVRLEAII